MYILLAISNNLNINSMAQKDNVFLAVIIMQIIIFLIPGILYCKLRGKDLTPSLRLKPRLSPSKLWLTVTSFFVLVSGSALIKLFLYSIGYYSTQYSLYQNYIPTSISGFANVLYIVVAIALMPAITEEFVFRGILLGEYSSLGCGKLSSICITALLFSMLHFDIFQLPVFFFGGVVLAFVTFVTDSLVCAVAIHFMNNVFSLLFESRLLKMISQTDSVIFVLFVLAVVFLVFTVFTLQSTERTYYLKGIRGEPSPTQKRKKKKKSKKLSAGMEAFISPVFILCVIAFIIITFAIQ